MKYLQILELTRKDRRYMETAFHPSVDRQHVTPVQMEKYTSCHSVYNAKYSHEIGYGHEEDGVRRTSSNTLHNHSSVQLYIWSNISEGNPMQNRQINKAYLPAANNDPKAECDLRISFHKLDKPVFSPEYDFSCDLVTLIYFGKYLCILKIQPSSNNVNVRQ